jgi:peptidyl-prolyl cis-trans isomerase SurA
MMGVFSMKKTIILVYTSLILAFFTGASSLTGVSHGAVLLDRVVATVNDEVVTWSELRSVIDIEAKELLQGLSDQERERRVKEFEKEYLAKMIDVKLQLQEAKKMQLEVSQADIDSAIDDIKTKYNLTDETLAASLEKEGLTLKKYRSNLTEQILLSKVVGIEVKSNVFISDSDIEKYYESNRQKYRDKEQVRIRQIFFSRPADDSEKMETESRARDVVSRARAGEDFSKLAGELSEDLSGESGGDLGYIRRGDVVKEVEDVAFALKSGEVSDPFWSASGLHIIMVEKLVKPADLQEVRKEIRDILFEESFRREHLEWIKRLRERSYIETHL